MDPNLIYEKTASGEEAMRERTRVVQRNLRMVLILVDGKSAVAELCAKTGNPQMTENALRELEQGAFIVPLQAEALSLLQQSRKVALEIKSAALEPFSEFSTFGDKNAPASGEASAPPGSSAAQSAYVPGDLSRNGGMPLDFSADVKERLEEAELRAVRGERSGFGARLKALFGGAAGEDDLRIAPVRRGPRPRSLGWPLRVVTGVLLICALLGAIAAFFPYGRYLPEIEAGLAQSLGGPVKIQSMHVGFYPRPGLFLEDVRLGEGGRQLRVAEMRLQPAPGSLFSSRLVFREIEAEGVELPAEGLGVLPAALAAFAQPSSAFAIEHVSLARAEVSLHGLALSGLEGEIRLDRHGGFQALSLHSVERGFRLEARPAAKGFEIEMEGQNWHPSANASYVFDSLNLAGKLDGSALQLSGLDVRLLGGTVRGEMLLAAGKQVSVSGQLVYERIDLKRLGGALGIDWLLEGSASGKLVFSGLADEWPGLPGALEGAGDVGVRQGVLGGIDLAEAVRRAASAPVRGGATRFEQMNGSLRLAQGAYRLSGTTLNSGLMHASGWLAVSRERQLSGALDVRLGSSSSQLRMPLSIGGTLKVPEVSVSRP